MFRELKPYATYRPVPDLPMVAPASWSVRPMRSLIEARSERGQPDLPLLTVARERGVFVRSKDDTNHNVIPDDLSNYKVARAGDLVINKMKAWQGSLGLAPTEGIVSPAYFVYEFKIDDPEYGEALLRSRPYVSLMGAASDGVRIGQWDLAIPRFRAIPVLVPSRAEQAAIVKYLGHAHARIDQAIAAKRKLIALLEEQKQAIISQAVTRGLDPTVPTKDSGILWLGRIPAHWGTRKLGWLFRTQGSGTTPPRDDQYGGDVPWIMSGDLNDGRVATTKKTVTRDAVVELSSLRVYGVGALVVAMYGATIGKNALTDVAAATNQACCVFADPREGVHLEYTQIAMTAGRTALAERGVGGGQPNVNAQIVKQFRVPHPPIGEQAAIAEACASEILRTGRIAEKTLKEIELLREFRMRLTSDVVTGQLDVREVAATLPAFVEPVSGDADCGEDELPEGVDDVLEEVDA